MTQEHPYAHYVRTLGRGKRARRSLERAEAREVFTGLLNGELTDSQLGALLMLLRVKEETPEELAGFIEATRAWMTERNGVLPRVDLDWPSYSGKKKHHPWYLLAARLLADDGVRILLHGGPHHTPGRLYTDEAMDVLGIPRARTTAELEDVLERENLVYIELEDFCPPLSEALMQRYELGLRSPVNSVVRSLNPAGAPLSAQTIFHPAYLDLHRDAAKLLGDPCLLLFKGEGGEVEIRPDATTRGMTSTPESTENWSLAGTLPREKAPGTADAEALLQLWYDDQDDYGREAVLQTLVVLLQGLGRAANPDEARRQAEQLWAQRDPARFEGPLVQAD